MQGEERSQTWTPRLKVAHSETRPRETWILQPFSHPMHAMPTECQPGRASPASTPGCFGGHTQRDSRNEGPETEGRIRGQTWQGLRIEVSCVSPEPRGQRVGYRQPLRLPSPTSFQAGQLRPHLSAGNPAAPRRGRAQPLLPGNVSVPGRSERKGDLGLCLLPLPHAPRRLGGGELMQLSQPLTDQPPRTQTWGLPTQPTAPTTRAAEPEVRKPEAVLSWALDRPSLPHSRRAQPRLYGASAPPTRPPPPDSGRRAPPLSLRP